ncbi:hypothetical protein D9758_009762 [Tetrapyrgos nigripes]|uniref:Uncharacterized protein n=1 Tax=Tetrapyrgos nigripes TaxID=182062 RepID=A0A8H5GJY4_9AGAR|nr:hypothetical protein D9758_009762 [Tetrapyrgos nigripes]
MWLSTRIPWSSISKGSSEISLNETPRTSYLVSGGGRLLGDASIFITLAMSLAAFDSKPSKGEPPSSSDNKTGIVRHLYGTLLSPRISRHKVSFGGISAFNGFKINSPSDLAKNLRLQPLSLGELLIEERALLDGFSDHEYSMACHWRKHGRISGGINGRTAWVYSCYRCIQVYFEKTAV